MQCIRAGYPNFWDLISQKLDRILAQNVRVNQVAGPYKDKHLTYKKGLCQSFQGSTDMNKTSQEERETWYTFTFWSNLQFGIKE